MNTKPQSQTPCNNTISIRLIEKLRAIETRCEEVQKEYKRSRGEWRRALERERYWLKEEWYDVKRCLHGHFRPRILERDGHKCRVCGSTENLELARIFLDSLIIPASNRLPPEERYSEKNMFILCNECHKRFDSLSGRFWRIGPKGISNAQGAIEILRDKDLLESPPCIMERVKRYKDKLMCREALTPVNALRKIIVFQQQNDLKKARRHLGVARRELNFRRKGGLLTQTQYEGFMEKLQQACEALDSGGRIDGLLDEVRQGLLEVVRTKVPQETFCEIEREGGLVSIRRLENKNENA